MDRRDTWLSSVKASKTIIISGPAVHRVIELGSHTKADVTAYADVNPVPEKKEDRKPAAIVC